MKFLVIGLGSMGKRRIRLLQQYIKNEVGQVQQDKWEIIGVDSNEERCEEVKEKYKISTFFTLEDALMISDIQCAIISTSPHTHASLISRCLEANLHIFTEINLIADGYDLNISLAKRKKRVLFLSSTFMYRKEMKYIKERCIRSGFNGMYRYHIGQYLPEWHPWENYQDFFVGRKDTNGCREIFAIELPWICDIFGDIISVQSMHKKASTLQIPYDDSYHVLIEHTSGVIGAITVDVVSPKAGRELEIWTEGQWMKWKGTPDSLSYYDNISKEEVSIKLYDDVNHTEGYNSFVVENAYYDELVDFISAVKGNNGSRYSMEKDKTIIEWIDKIESM